MTQKKNLDGRDKICEEYIQMLITETGLGGGWSGGAMVLGKLLVPGHPTIWITVGQGPTALARGAGKVGKKAGNTHICQ